MPTLRSSSQPRENSLRKQLLNKKFLQNLAHDDPLDNHSGPEPYSQVAVNLHTSPYPIREQHAVSEVARQKIKMKDKEILFETSIMSSEPNEKKQKTSHDDETPLTLCMKCDDSQYDSFPKTSIKIILQDSSSSASPATTLAKLPKSYIPAVEKTEKSDKSIKRTLKKYSKILSLVERLERSVATFCDIENKAPNVDTSITNHNSISIFQNIKSSQQKKQYVKYFNKTLKVCHRLEGEISLYSQYIATLETAVSTIPKGSQLSNMLEVKLKSAHKFHEDNPSHEELKTLIRQLKLVNLLIKKFEF